MSQAYLIKHRVSSNQGDRKSNQLSTSSQMLVFADNKNQSNQEKLKTCRSRVENERIQPTFRPYS